MSNTPQTGRPTEIGTDDVLALFDDQDLPFLTSRIVTDRLGCSKQTAHRKLHSLADEGELVREEISSRVVVWFQADYEAAEQVADTLRKQFDLGDLDVEHLAAFAEQPYKLLPKSENEYYVITPRFVPFSVGHLRDADEAWKTFVINKYVNWLGDLPEDFRDRIEFEQKYETAVVEDGVLTVDPDELSEAWDEFSTARSPDAIPPDDILEDMDWNKLQGLGKRHGVYRQNMGRETLEDRLRELRSDDKIPLKDSREFDVIAGLIEDGNLPFAPNAVDPKTLRPDPENVVLRDYQERAWDAFLEAGQVGVFWPPGMGKTFFGMYAGDRLPGDKLVIVPSSTLESQWETRIEETVEHPEEWEVRTYQYMTTGDNAQDYQGDNAPRLTIYDEAHTLPANTFSKLATIETQTRIGLSATPYREDDRTDYIFALTGIPVGIEWEELVEHGYLEYPTVSLYLYRTRRQKVADLHDLTDGAGKTLIYCDGIDAGKKLARELDVPFVYGETPKADRIEMLRDNRVIIASRVADEGVSLDELDQIIQFDFHGASRRQELQRAGRLMHTDGLGHHIIQMTDDEHEKFSGRLLSLEEKGIQIQAERRA